MAGNTIVLVTPVDSENNLFRVEHAVSAELGCDSQPNAGYIMINQADATGYRHLCTLIE